MFTNAIVLGGVALAVAALNAEIGHNETVAAILNQSPLVTVGTALGIGALIEFFGDPIYRWQDRLHRPTEDIVRGLPEYGRMRDELSYALRLGSRLGLSRESLSQLVIDYEFRTKAPAALVDYVDQLKGRDRMMWLIWATGTVTALLCLIALLGGDLEGWALNTEGWMLPSAMMGWFLLVWEPTAKYRLIYVRSLEEHFLRTLATGVPVEVYRIRPPKVRWPWHWWRKRMLDRTRASRVTGRRAI